VKREVAWTEEVFAVTFRGPVAVAGTVIDVVKAPDTAVLRGKVAEPTIMVPVVEALKPVPLTVTADPAGPVEGLRETWAVPGAAWAAWAGKTAVSAMATPSPTNPARNF
jgi:hypothetical protein